MLLINISTDKVALDDGNRQELLDRNGIEDILGPTLLDRHQKAPFQEIFLINWPGWFTNLRVWTLMLNMMNAVLEQKIQIFAVDKLTLFARLVGKNMLPAIGAIYLWQKHNIWLTDFTTNLPTTKEIKLSELPTDAFLDEVYDPYRPNWTAHMLHFSNENDTLFVSYQDKKQEIAIKDLNIKPSIHVEANYMIEPVLN
jgi:hypothetical protein